MKRMKRWVWAGLLIAVLGMLGSGCTQQSKRKRLLARAERDYQAQRYERAELEYLAVLRIPPPSPLAVARLGSLYYEEGRMETAVAFLRSAVTAETNDLELRLKLGRTDLNLYGRKEARQEAVYVLEHQATNDEALVLLVEASGGTNELADCRVRLASLAPQGSQRAGFHIAAGLLKLAGRDLQGARAECEQAIALEPGSSAAHLALGNVLQLQNDSKSAEAALAQASALAPVRSAARLRYADFKVQRSDLAGARQLLEEITMQAPDYIPAWNRLADIALSQNRLNDCQSLLKSVLDRDSLNYEALLLSGRLNRAKRDDTGTLRAFERLSGLYSRSAQAKYELAVAQLQKGEQAKASATLLEVLKLDPAHQGAGLLLAQLELSKGDYAAAEALLTRLSEDRTSVVATHLLLAEAYRRQGKAEAALRVYQRLAAAFPHDPRAPSYLGLIYLQEGQRAAARRTFEKALELEPGFLPATEQLVALELAETNYPGALKHVQMALDKNPKAAAPLYWMARLAQAQGKSSEAEAPLVKAIALEPGYQPAYALLTQLYLSSRRYAQALQNLESLVTNNPSNVGAWMQIGMLRSKLGNYVGARDAYEKLLKVDARFSPALNNLACLYSEQFGRLDQAYELARQSHELSPNDPAAADTLGWVFYQRGEYARALGLLQQSAEKLTGLAEVQFHWGMANYMLGREEPARRALQAAAQVREDFTGKAEAQACLAVLAVDVKAADPQAVAGLEKTLTTRPRDPILLTRLGAIREGASAFPEARTYYEKAWELNTNQVAPALGLARLWAEHLGDNDKAMEWAKRARGLSPDDPAVSYLLGRLAYRTGDFGWALSLLQESARKLANDPEVLYDLAWAQYSMGQVAPAAATMQAATNSNPTFRRAELAGRFLDLGRLFEDPAAAVSAAARVQALLKAEPGYGPGLMAAGVAAEQQGRAQAAKEAYERMLQQLPKFMPATKRLAVVCVLQLGDYQRGYELAQQARQALPGDTEVAKALGIAAYQRGEPARAAQLLAECSAKGPADAEALYYLGMANYQLKRKEPGKQALNRALALNLDPQRTQEARRVLGLLN